MRTTKLGKHDVVMYDSIDEIPIRRFHRFNKMMLVDSGIGSDLTDVDKHLERLKVYMADNKTDLALREIDNLRTNIFFIMQHLCPRHLAFAALVKSIDGEDCDDISDDGLLATMKRLEDVPTPALNREFDEVKKKIDDDLIQYFPSIFDDVASKNYYDKLRSRTMAILEGIIKGEDDDIKNRIDTLTNELITYSKPQSFSGANNAETQFDSLFERMCHILSHHLNVSPKDYTITEFYSAFEYVKELLKTPKKRIK